MPDAPAFAQRDPLSYSRGRKRQGILYERKALEYLARSATDFGLELLSGQWVAYRTIHDAKTKMNFCQPDAIFVDEERKKLTLFEIKLQHTSDAWWQLRKLYEPVLHAIFPSFSIASIELVRWMDPHTPFPETFYFAGELAQARDSLLGVHIFCP